MKWSPEEPRKPDPKTRKIHEKYVHEKYMTLSALDFADLENKNVVRCDKNVVKNVHFESKISIFDTFYT